MGINYTCVKFQWSPIKKVLWREVKQNIQWLFKRTRVLTFRRSHLSFKFPIVSPTFPIRSWASCENVDAIDSTCLQRTRNYWNRIFGKQTYTSIVKGNLFLKVSLFSEIVGFVHTSQPIESQQTVFSNFSTNHGKNLETAFCMQEVPIMIKKELTREQI